MSKMYAYFRVSTQIKNKKEKKCNEKQREQDYERQKWLIAQSGLKIEKVFEERITGGIRGDERIEFKKMLSVLKPGDTVVFTESSRFGRNYIDCFDIVDIITLEYEVNIKFLSNGMTLLGGKKLNPYEWMSLSQFFLADEFQKRLIGFWSISAFVIKPLNFLTQVFFACSLPTFLGYELQILSKRASKYLSFSK